MVVVGLPPEKLPSSVACIEGRPYSATARMPEFVVGTELARRLGLQVGSLIPPFYQNAKGERVSKVVGIFSSDVSMWQSRLIFTSFDMASNIFDHEGLATDVLVYCRPGYEAQVAASIMRSVTFASSPSGSIRPRVTVREDLQVLIPRTLLHREGIFNLHFLLVFVVGILVVAVTSAFGLTERRREVGILKATGWQTDEIMLRSMVESVLLSVAGASLSLSLSFVWLKWFNGYWVASIFLHGVAAAPSFRVPFCLTPIPALLSFLISLAVVMTGSLFSTWRAATVPPAEAMR